MKLPTKSSRAEKCIFPQTVYFCASTEDLNFVKSNPFIHARVMNQQTKFVTRSQRAHLKVKCSKEQKIIAARNVLSGKWKYEHAAGKSGVTVGSIQRWVTQLKNGLKMHTEGGRPGFIAKELQKRVIAEVIGDGKSTVKCNKRRFTTILQEAANETSIALGKPCTTLSDRYIHDFQNENEIREGNAEVIDNAHLVALKDPRHALSFAVMHHYLRERVPRGLFVTFDKTRFDLPKSDQQIARAVFRDKRGQSLKCAAPNKKSSQGNCSVSLFVVINDTGKLADLVYLVKVNSLPKDTIDVHPAKCLDISNSAEGTAYLIFYGESTPNKDASLEWLMYNVVLPFITKLRSKVKGGEQKRVSLQVDGDPRQLQVLASPGIIQACAEKKITPNKSSASCTPTEAQLDEGKLFLSSKNCFRRLVKKGYYPEDDQDVEDLKEIFREHLRKYPKKHAKGKKPSVALGRYFTDVIKCLYTVVEALRLSEVSKLARKSFKTTGVVPYNPSVIRDKCQFPWSDAQKAQFVAAVPVLSKTFETNFELKEKDFDDAGIPANNTSRDGLPVHRRRCLLLHAPHVLQDLQKQAVPGTTAEI